MDAPLPKSFSLYCDSERHEYKLRTKGSDWTRVFASTDEAMQHASTLVMVETKITVYNADGKVLLFTTVPPLGTKA